MLDSARRTSHYIRTDKAIVSAFCNLLKEKNYEEITIQNILDETPISRAAFYQHFLDKESIGEQLLAEYFVIMEEVKNEMVTTDETFYTAIVSKFTSKHRDTLEALVKIRTPKVNLEKTMRDIMEKQYLDNARDNRPTLRVEAKVFAAAMTEFQMYSINSTPYYSMGDATVFNTVMIETFLKIMKQDENLDMRKYLYSQLPKM